MFFKTFRYRVLPSRSDEYLALRHQADQVYQRYFERLPTYLQSTRDPQQWLEVYAYQDEATYRATVERMQADPEIARLWRRFRTVLDPAYAAAFEEFRAGEAVGPWMSAPANAPAAYAPPAAAPVSSGPAIAMPAPAPVASTIVREAPPAPPAFEPPSLDDLAAPELELPAFDGDEVDRPADEALTLPEIEPMATVELDLPEAELDLPEPEVDAEPALDLPVFEAGPPLLAGPDSPEASLTAPDGSELGAIDAAELSSLDDLPAFAGPPAFDEEAAAGLGDLDTAAELGDLGELTEMSGETELADLDLPEAEALAADEIVAQEPQSIALGGGEDLADLELPEAVAEEAEFDLSPADAEPDLIATVEPSLDFELPPLAGSEPVLEMPAAPPAPRPSVPPLPAARAESPHVEHLFIPAEITLPPLNPSPRPAAAPPAKPAVAKPTPLAQAPPSAPQAPAPPARPAMPSVEGFGGLEPVEWDDAPLDLPPPPSAKHIGNGSAHHHAAPSDSGTANGFDPLAANSLADLNGADELAPLDLDAIDLGATEQSPALDDPDFDLPDPNPRRDA